MLYCIIFYIVGRTRQVGASPKPMGQNTMAAESDWNALAGQRMAGPCHQLNVLVVGETHFLWLFIEGHIRTFACRAGQGRTGPSRALPRAGQGRATERGLKSRGFDSSTIFNWKVRGGILMSMGSFPEMLSQRTWGTIFQAVVGVPS